VYVTLNTVQLDDVSILCMVATDLTQQRRTEEIVASERLARSIFDQAGEIIVVCDESGQIIRANKMACQLCGQNPMLQPFDTMFPLRDDSKKDYPCAKKEGDGKGFSLSRVLRKDFIKGMEVCFTGKDGQLLSLLLSATPLLDRQNEILGCVLTMADITDRKQAEEALRKARDELEQRVEERTAELVTINAQLEQEIEEHKQAEEALRTSEVRYRTLFEESRDAIFITTREGNFVDINQYGMDLFGYSREEIIRLNIKDFYVYSDARARFQQEIEQEGFVGDYEVKFKKKDGAEMDCLLNSTVQKASDGTIQGYQSIVRDVTDRKRAEEDIRLLTQQLIHVQEIERQKISCDLHDGLAQDLSALRIKLDTLFDGEPDVSPEKRQRVSELSKMVKKAITDVRDMAYELHPAGLDQLGLAQAAHRYCKEFSYENGLKIDFFPAGLDSIKLNFDTEITLYRLIQEGLTNVQKHAQASHVTIRLDASFPYVILCIEDNGKGFRVERTLKGSLEKKCMGLYSMMQRIAFLNGKIEIKSRLNQGTKILAQVPYKVSKNEQENRLDY
jgi:PAS domain S-box-containing protein